MLCKNWKNNKMMLAVLCLGIVSLAYGLITFLAMKPDEHSFSTLLGMFTGFGVGIIGVAVVKLLRDKTISPEKREQQEIEKSDERNIAISRAAGGVGFSVGVLLLAVLSFVFMALEYRVPSFVCVGGIYVMVVAYLIAHKVYEKRF